MSRCARRTVTRAGEPDQVSNVVWEFCTDTEAAVLELLGAVCPHDAMAVQLLKADGTVVTYQPWEETS